MLPGSTASRPAGGCAATASGRPVLMLTARDAVEDRVAGLDSGRRRLPGQAVRVRRAARAAARAGAAGRAASGPRVLEVGDLRLDPATRGCGAATTPIELSAKEFALLETFMRRPGRGALAPPSARARVGLRLREPLQRRRRLRPAPARQDRRAVRTAVARDRPRRRLPAARRTREPAADPDPGDGGVRASRWRPCSRLAALPLPARSARTCARARPRAAAARAGPRGARRASRARRSGGAPQPLRRAGESYAQLLAPARPRAGRDARRSARIRAHCRRACARAARAESSLDRRSVPGLDEPSRLLRHARPRRGQRLVLVVGDHARGPRGDAAQPCATSS